MISLTKFQFMTNQELEAALAIETKLAWSLSLPPYHFISKGERVWFSEGGYRAARYNRGMARAVLIKDLIRARVEYSGFLQERLRLTQAELKGMEKRALELLRFFKNTEASLKNSSLSLSQLDAAQVALAELKDMHEHALKVAQFSRHLVPSYYQESERFEELMLNYLKGEGRELLYTWAAVIMHCDEDIRYDYRGLGELSEEEEAQFKEQGKVRILIEAPIKSYYPSFFNAFKIRDHYLNVPLVAAEYFKNRKQRDLIELGPLGLTDSDIETLTVLHRGAAYQSLEDAAIAAINLR